MKDSLYIGPVPYDEQCAQVGQDNYLSQARKECKVFIEQLIETFGPEPENTLIRTKSNPHDYGSYLDVVIDYNPNCKKSVNYAFNIENNTPANWSKKSRDKLGIVLESDLQAIRDKILQDYGPTCVMSFYYEDDESFNFVCSDNPIGRSYTHFALDYFGNGDYVGSAVEESNRKILLDNEELVERLNVETFGCSYGYENIIFPIEALKDTELLEIISALENYPVLDEMHLSELEHDKANELWSDCYSVSERIEYIRKHRSQFDFCDFADLRANIRGDYFSGYASELLQP